MTQPITLSAMQIYISASSGRNIEIVKVTPDKVYILRHNGREVVPYSVAVYNIQNKLWLFNKNM